MLVCLFGLFSMFILFVFIVFAGTCQTCLSAVHDNTLLRVMLRPTMHGYVHTA